MIQKYKRKSKNFLEYYTIFIQSILFIVTSVFLFMLISGQGKISEGGREFAIIFLSPWPFIFLYFLNIEKQIELYNDKIIIRRVFKDQTIQIKDIISIKYSKKSFDPFNNSPNYKMVIIKFSTLPFLYFFLRKDFINSMDFVDRLKDILNKIEKVYRKEKYKNQKAL